MIARKYTVTFKDGAVLEEEVYDVQDAMYAACISYNAINPDAQIPQVVSVKASNTADVKVFDTLLAQATEMVGDILDVTKDLNSKPKNKKGHNGKFLKRDRS